MTQVSPLEDRFPLGAKVRWSPRIHATSNWVGVVTAHLGDNKIQVDGGFTCSVSMLEVISMPTDDPAERPYAHCTREQLEGSLQRMAAQIATLQREKAELEALVVSQLEMLAGAA